MKLHWICAVLTAGCILSGCGQPAQTNATGIEKITADFFDSDYEYTRTTVQYTNGESEESGQTTVLEGAVVQSPYAEAVHVASSPTPSAWANAY